MSERVIVTGGAGFIGCNVVSALNAQGADDIIVVDRLGENDKWKNLVGLRYEDFLDKEDFLGRVFADTLGEVDCIIHLGACSATTERDAGYLAENNYRYTRMLCEWCVQHDARFIYASSAATYGDGGLGYSDDDAVTPTLKPLNMYGYSKQMFDVWALKHGHLNTIVGIKYFNVYGPHEEHKGDMRSVVHKAYGQVADTGEVQLFKSYRPDYKDGEQVRDFVYVKDAVAAMLYFHEQRDLSGLFNCGTGEARTWVDLATAVFKAMDRTPNIRFVEMPERLREKYQYHTQADVTKLRKAGYVAPFASIEEGVRDYVQSYLAVGE